MRSKSILDSKGAVCQELLSGLPTGDATKKSSLRCSDPLWLRSRQGLYASLRLLSFARLRKSLPAWKLCLLRYSAVKRPALSRPASHRPCGPQRWPTSPSLCFQARLRRTAGIFVTVSLTFARLASLGPAADCASAAPWFFPLDTVEGHLLVWVEVLAAARRDVATP